MNTYSVVITKKAAQDILNIKYYIKYMLLSAQASENFEKALLQKLDRIGKNPYAYSNELIGTTLYHKALVKRYIVIFRIDEQTHTVHIIAIGHSLQSRKNIISKNKKK